MASAVPLRSAPRAKTLSALARSVSSLVDCSKLFAAEDVHGGVGVFAAVPIKRGELVERGVVKRLPLDGNDSTWVFTWSEDRREWATGCGLIMFYNTALLEQPNTDLVRHLDTDTFETYALRDIAEREPVTHVYKSLEWRRCFAPLREMRDRGAVPIQEPAPPGAAAASPVDCSKVYAAKDGDGQVSVFAAVPLRAGEVLERGVARRVTLNATLCKDVLPWGADASVSAVGSGCSLLYAAAPEGASPNAEMRCQFDSDRFEIIALRDVAPDELLTVARPE